MNIKRRIIIWVLYTAAVSAFPVLAATGPLARVVVPALVKGPPPVANSQITLEPSRYEDGVVMHRECSVYPPRRAKRCGPIRRVIRFVFRRR